MPATKIFVALMIKALSSSETSVVTRATRRNITEDGILLTQLNHTFIGPDLYMARRERIKYFHLNLTEYVAVIHAVIRVIKIWTVLASHSN
jgi:hypothetical protein